MGILSLILYLCAWSLAILLKVKTPELFSEALLRSLFMISIGFGGFIKFIGHTFFSEKTASYKDWVQTPFQHEVGVAHLSFSTLAFLGFFYQVYWVAIAIGVIIFYLGNAMVQVTELKRQGKLSLQSGSINLYMDLIVPITLCLGLVLHSFNI